MVDELVGRAQAEGLQLTGEGGLPQQLTKRLLESAFDGEITDHRAAKGLTTREIAAHLAQVYGVQVSRQTTSTITDKVIEGMAEWQNRPLDVHSVIFIDAVHVKSVMARSPAVPSIWPWRSSVKVTGTSLGWGSATAVKAPSTGFNSSSLSTAVSRTRGWSSARPDRPA